MVTVLVPKLIDLFVRVSVVALPTNVSVAVGRVNVKSAAPTFAAPVRISDLFPLLVPSLN